MIEAGTQVTGAKTEISEDSPMREGLVYEFAFEVTSTPLGPLEDLRALIISAIMSLIANFKGLQILYWRLTETEFLFQVKGESIAGVGPGPVPLGGSIWEQVALSVVCIAAQGLLLALGIVIVLRGIWEFAEPEVAIKYLGWVVVGALGALFLWSLWHRRKRV